MSDHECSCANVHTHGHMPFHCSALARPLLASYTLQGDLIFLNVPRADLRLAAIEEDTRMLVVRIYRAARFIEQRAYTDTILAMILASRKHTTTPISK